MTVADPAQALVVIGRRHLYVGATYGFDDNSSHITFLAQAIVNVIDAAQRALPTTAEDAATRIMRRYVFSTRQQWADAATEDGFAADRNGVERSTMEGVPHRQSLEAPGG